MRIHLPRRLQSFFSEGFAASSLAPPLIIRPPSLQCGALSSLSDLLLAQAESVARLRSSAGRQLGACPERRPPARLGQRHVERLPGRPIAWCRSPSSSSLLRGMLPWPPDPSHPASPPSPRARSATQLASGHRCAKRCLAVRGAEGAVPCF